MMDTQPTPKFDDTIGALRAARDQLTSTAQFKSKESLEDKVQKLTNKLNAVSTTTDIGVLVRKSLTEFLEKQQDSDGSIESIRLLRTTLQSLEGAIRDMTDNDDKIRSEIEVIREFKRVLVPAAASEILGGSQKSKSDKIKKFNPPVKASDALATLINSSSDSMTKSEKVDSAQIEAFKKTGSDISQARIDSAAVQASGNEPIIAVVAPESVEVLDKIDKNTQQTNVEIKNLRKDLTGRADDQNFREDAERSKMRRKDKVSKPDGAISSIAKEAVGGVGGADGALLLGGLLAGKGIAKITPKIGAFFLKKVIPRLAAGAIGGPVGLALSALSIIGPLLYSAAASADDEGGDKPDVKPPVTGSRERSKSSNTPPASPNRKYDEKSAKAFAEFAGVPTKQNNGKVASKSMKSSSGAKSKVALPKKEIDDAIAAAAQITGVDRNTLLAFAQQESSFNPDARPTLKGGGLGSARGLFQIQPAAFEDVQKNIKKLSGGNEELEKFVMNANYQRDIMDPYTNSVFGALYTKVNASRIAPAVGADNIGANELYTSHLLGAGGAKALLSADDTEIASKVVPKSAAANPGIFKESGTGRDLTVAEVKKKIDAKIGAKARGFQELTGTGDSPVVASQESSTKLKPTAAAMQNISERAEKVAVEKDSPMTPAAPVVVQAPAAPAPAPVNTPTQVAALPLRNPSFQVLNDIENASMIR